MERKIGARLDAFFKEKGFRKTSQREAIVQAAFSTRSHYTAEELLLMVRRIDPAVSRATVYRTLPLLVESGLLKELDLGRDQTVYDPNFIEHPHHNHIICLDCGKIVEFEDHNINVLEDCISRRLGFTPAVKMIRIEANCEDLRLKGTCPNRKGERCVKPDLKPPMTARDGKRPGRKERATRHKDAARRR
jgi:Fur family ferric uptake transcriptional regulator